MEADNGNMDCSYLWQMQAFGLYTKHMHSIQCNISEYYSLCWRKCNGKLLSETHAEQIQSLQQF